MGENVRPVSVNVELLGIWSVEFELTNVADRRPGKNGFDLIEIPPPATKNLIET